MIISPFKVPTYCAGIQNRVNFVFNLFILDYFGIFSVGFGLSVHLKLTSKSGDQILLKDLC